MAVAGDASAGYAIRKTFQKSYQYALFNYGQQLLRVSFEDYAPLVNEPLLKMRMSRIEKFDPRKPAIIRQYRSLFSTLGSHIITAMNYGGRLQLVSGY